MPDQIDEQKPAQPASADVREAMKDAADETASAVHEAGHTTAETIQKPPMVAAIAGAAVVASAVIFGVLETAVGGAAAYLAYRWLRGRQSEATAQ